MLYCLFVEGGGCISDAMWVGGECMPVLFKKDFMMYCIAWGGGGVYASAFNEDFLLYCIVCGGGVLCQCFLTKAV